jgi:hypothetical protein
LHRRQRRRAAAIAAALLLQQAPGASGGVAACERSVVRSAVFDAVPQVGPPAPQLAPSAHEGHAHTHLLSGSAPAGPERC